MTLFLLNVLYLSPLQRQGCLLTKFHQTPCHPEVKDSFVEPQTQNNVKNIHLFICETCLFSRPLEKDALSPDPSSFQTILSLTRDVYQRPIHPPGRRHVLWTAEMSGGRKQKYFGELLVNACISRGASASHTAGVWHDDYASSRAIDIPHTVLPKGFPEEIYEDPRVIIRRGWPCPPPLFHLLERLPEVPEGRRLSSR